MKPKMLTISALETYQRCPRQYLYGAIYGFRGEEAAYQLFWKATHNTLKALKDKLETTRGVEKESLEAQFLTQEETREL